MAEENANLQNEDDEGIIDDAGSDEAAGIRTPEDTVTRLEKMISEQNATIAALIEQNQQLSENLTNVVRSKPMSPVEEPEDDPQVLPDDYEPLKDLGKQIGKKAQ